MTTDQPLPELKEYDSNSLASFQIEYTLQDGLWRDLALVGIKIKIKEIQQRYNFVAYPMAVGEAGIKINCTQPREFTDLTYILSTLRELPDQRVPLEFRNSPMRFLPSVHFVQSKIHALPGRKFILRKAHEDIIMRLKGANSSLERRVAVVEDESAELKNQLQQEKNRYEILQGANDALEEENQGLLVKLQDTIKYHSAQLEMVQTRANHAEGTARQIADGYGVLQGECKLLSNRIEESKNALKSANGALDQLNIQNEDLKRRLAAAPKTDSLTLEELATLTARTIAGNVYDEAVEAYEAAFPQRMEDFVRFAFEGDERTYVLSPEVLAIAAPLKLNMAVSLEELEVEVRERTKSFEESSSYSKLWLPYQGGLTARNFLSIGTLNEQQRRIAKDAEEAIEAFLEKSANWNNERSAAQEFLKAIQERREAYILAHSNYNTSTLPFTIPLVSFASCKEKSIAISYIVPCTQETAEKNFTRAVIGDLTVAIKESLQHPPSKTDVRSCLGSHVIALELDNPESDTLFVPQFRQRVSNACSQKVLSKLGMQWKPYSLGETYE